MKEYILDKDIRLKDDDVNDAYYAFSISSGEHYILTKTGYLILKAIEIGQGVEEIINFIQEKESIDYDVCRTDTINFLNKVEKTGIIALHKEENQYGK